MKDISGCVREPVCRAHAYEHPSGWTRILDINRDVGNGWLCRLGLALIPISLQAAPHKLPCHKAILLCTDEYQTETIRKLTATTGCTLVHDAWRPHA